MCESGHLSFDSIGFEFPNVVELAYILSMTAYHSQGDDYFSQFYRKAFADFWFSDMPVVQVASDSGASDATTTSSAGDSPDVSSCGIDHTPPQVIPPTQPVAHSDDTATIVAIAPLGNMSEPTA